MSTDVAVLSSLAQITQQELRYFELVTLRYQGKQRRVYLCVGKHSIFFVKKDLSGKVKNGCIHYGYIDKVVEDKLSSSDFLLLLGKGADLAWGGPGGKIFILSTNRESLLQHVQACFLIDYMWRFGGVCVFPRHSANLVKDYEPPLGDDEDDENKNVVILPFIGYKLQRYGGYSFFLKEDFEEVSGVLQRTQTGHYLQKSTGHEVIIHVHDPINQNLLPMLARDHVRWVSLEYKQMLTSNCDAYYMLRNCAYTKRMNLTDDIARWENWQLLIKTRKHILIVIVLRRQYIPPLLNACQDIVVMLKVKNKEAEYIEKRKKGLIDDNNASPTVKKEQTTWPSDEELCRECELIADSLSPLEDDFPVYRDILQAKLDVLRFDEDGYRWIESFLKLEPSARKDGKIFVKSIFALLHADGMLMNGDKMLESAEFALGKKESEDAWQTLPVFDNPLSIPEKMLDIEESSIARNNYNKRLAKYLAYCVDGGICGTKFTLYELVDAKAGLSPESQKKISKCIEYLLHLRPTEMTRAYFDLNVATQLQDNLEGWSFNERVMQILLESDHIKKLFGRSKELEYAGCVGRLLASPTVSASLKSSLCRQILQSTFNRESAGILAPALVSVLKTSTSYYVQTCVSASLVSMSAETDQIKNLLMASGIAPLLIRQLTSKDDDLVYHTLMLLVNMTKHTHHRNILVTHGLLPIIVDILSSSYHSIGYKQKILVQLAAVIGQCCNDEESRKILITAPHDFTIDCLLYIFDEAPVGSALECKLLFALRQCCTNSTNQKFRVGQHCCLKLVEELQDLTDFGKALDFVYNALCFFLVVAEKVENASTLQAANIKDVLQAIRDNLYDNPNILEKNAMLAELIRNQTHREEFGVAM